MQTIFVNLFGGPGSAKSSIAARVFAELKLMNYDCELITEWVKDKVWSEHDKILENQLYIFAKQNNKHWQLNGKVEVAITDSPLLLSLIYGKDYPDSFYQLVRDTHHSYRNINIFLERSSTYSDKGRLQNREEVLQIDHQIRDMLGNEGIKTKFLRVDPFTFGHVLGQIEAERRDHGI